MHVDQHEEPSDKGDKRANAQAGPSSQPDLPVVFLPPSGQQKRKVALDSTQDLISRFQLINAYDKYVRPFIQPGIVGEARSGSTNSDARFHSPSHDISFYAAGTVDKGKGREAPLAAMPMNAPTPGVDGGDGDDGEEEGVKGDKKQKNNYRHLIKGIPGKHSMKKDDYLQTMMLVPPKQHIQMSKFDPRTQREAFSVSLDGLKAWNINTLVAESPQAREDRKKRKELKKLAKAQAQAAQTGIPLPVPFPTTSASAAPTPGSRLPQTPASVGIGTPRPHGPGPGPPVHSIPNQMTGIAPPRSATPIARPGSRARKREFEDDGLPNGIAGTKRAPPYSAGSKSGMPRPSKRPRTDGTPHQMGLPPIPQQQPTPQGV